MRGCVRPSVGLAQVDLLGNGLNLNKMASGLKLGFRKDDSRTNTRADRMNERIWCLNSIRLVTFLAPPNVTIFPALLGIVCVTPNCFSVGWVSTVVARQGRFIVLNSFPIKMGRGDQKSCSDAGSCLIQFTKNKAGYTAQDAPSMRAFHLRK